MGRALKALKALEVPKVQVPKPRPTFYWLSASLTLFSSPHRIGGMHMALLVVHGRCPQSLQSPQSPGAQTQANIMPAVHIPHFIFFASSCRWHAHGAVVYLWAVPSKSSKPLKSPKPRCPNPGQHSTGCPPTLLYFPRLII